ncbi:hypothetical protein GJY02_22785 [Salmonella enterica]|nr:hypothetical protein [Salmonella enterica]
MIRKNKGDFFYYLEMMPDGETFTFEKKMRAFKEPDGGKIKTKRRLYIKTVRNTADGLASFKANTSDFDHAVLLDMLNSK